MSPAKVPAAILPALLALLLANACFEHPSQAITRHSSSKCSPAAGFGGANEQAIPASFPKDFPVYPRARFVAATHSPARDSVTWTSTATTAAIRDFYEKQLQSGDWQLYGDQYSDPCEAYWHVERRSNTHYGGVLSLYSGPAGAGSKFINAGLGKK
jgi:hypothetical protein